MRTMHESRGMFGTLGLHYHIFAHLQLPICPSSSCIHDTVVSGVHLIYPLVDHDRYRQQFHLTPMMTDIGF